MERLNDIINRTNQRRQQGDSRDVRDPRSQTERRAAQGQRSDSRSVGTGSSSSQGAPLTRRPLPEQTARLGQSGSRAPQSAQSPQSSTQGVPPRKYYQHTPRVSQASRSSQPLQSSQSGQPPRNRVQQEPDYSSRSRYPQSSAQTVRDMYPPLTNNDQAHATRPLYNYDQSQRANDAGSTPISNRSSYYRNTGRYAQDAQQIQQPAPAREGDYYDAYPPLPQADVQEDWEDDTAAMRYGDWEDDGHDGYDGYDSSELPPYTSSVASRSHSGNVPATGYTHPSYLSHLSRDLTNSRSHESEMEPRGSGGSSMPYSPPTRNLRELRELQEMQEMQGMQEQLHMPSSRLPSVPAPAAMPQSIPQETRYHRHTQPLDPQTIVNMTRDGQHESMRSSQLARSQNSGVQSLQAAQPSSSVRSACPICKGAGFLRADVPYGHPNFGKPIACECKEAERREKRRQQLLELSDLSAFQQSSFKNFNTRFPGVHPTVKEAFEEAFKFAQNPDGWLILIGPNGCGKTHLAAAIANQNLRGGAVVLFTVVPDLLAHLRSTFSSNATEAYDQRFAKMREAELLVLDDLGAHQGSAWASEKLFQLLNYRYNSGFPTVITANRQGLAGLDERILSRMSDTALVTTVVMNGAVDYRRQNPRREALR